MHACSEWVAVDEVCANGLLEHLLQTLRISHPHHLSLSLSLSHSLSLSLSLTLSVSLSLSDV